MNVVLLLFQHSRMKSTILLYSRLGRLCVRVCVCVVSQLEGCGAVCPLPCVPVQFLSLPRTLRMRFTYSPSAAVICQTGLATRARRELAPLVLSRGIAIASRARYVERCQYRFRPRSIEDVELLVQLDRV